ncbi:hypothetical protein, partial [Pararhizobium polonicum]|uniref:hypothetical protein n=1 Tax=Pararhizobium polonicum TaxID=1612624 RepID=UPI001AECCBB9
RTSAAHVSLSLYSIVKKQTDKSVENLTPRAQTSLPETPNPHQTFIRNFRASSSVASSAAALVGERFIGDTPERSQQANAKKFKINWFCAESKREACAKAFNGALCWRLEGGSHRPSPLSMLP